MTKQVALTQGRFALVDDDDYNFINQWKWTYSKKGYAFRSDHFRDSNGKKKSKTIYMHKDILSRNGFETDHINGDKSNNKKENLRLVSHHQNCMNKMPRKLSSSSFKGVSYDKKRNKWKARIGFKMSSIFLGRFSSEEEACAAYNSAAAKYHGEYACFSYDEKAVENRT